MTSGLIIRQASEDDIPFIMALEQQPENIYVHHSDAATHQAQMRDDGFVYLIGEAEGSERVAYALLVREGDRSIEWKRVISSKPGGGRGKGFMQAVLDTLFERDRISRVWLDVYEENARARHVYTSLGFKEVGTDTAKVPGRTLVVMEIGKP